MRELNTDATEWDRLSPELDEALAGLKETDRNVLLLRFTEGRNHREVGVVLGLTEEAAKKRVNRALDRLRSVLIGKGVTLSAAILTVFLDEQFAGRPPSGLSAAISRCVKSGATPSGAATELVRQIASAWRRARISLAGLILVPATLIITLVLTPNTPERPANNAPTNPTASTAARAADATRLPIAGETFRLQVVAADSGEPIAGASVSVLFLLNRNRITRDDLFTDSRGVCEVPLPRGELGLLAVGANIVGWENRRFKWIRSWQHPLPTGYVLKLGQAGTVGGRVVNEQQRPVAGVSVWLASVHDVGGAASEEPDEDRDRLGCPLRLPLGLTDAQGRWTCGTIPPSPGLVSIEFEHPGFVPARLQASSLDDHPASREMLENLRTRRAITVVRPGFIASGKVLDPGGNPVAGARIAPAWNEPGVMTDSEGQFIIRSLPQGEALQVATAEGFAPKAFVAVAGGAAVQVRLEPGGLLRARIINRGGEPIAGASLSLAPNDTMEERFGGGMIGWDDVTDADGRVTWRSAPPNKTLMFSANAPGYAHPAGQLNLLKLRTDGSEQTITLQPIVMLHGTVVDAASGAPIPRFKAIPNDERSALYYGTNGQFQFVFGPGDLRVQVEAEGYAIEVGRPTLGPNGEPRCDFRLRREELIRGLVLNPDGTPAEGAEVALGTLKCGIQLGHGKFLRDNSFSIVTVADASGRFAFPLARAPHSLAAISAAGFGRARVRAGQTAEVRIEPFGEVTGTAIIQGRPASGVAVRLMSSLQLAMLMSPRTFNVGTLWFDGTNFRCLTDEQGRFRFTKVPAGDVQVGLHPTLWPHLTETKGASVVAGRTTIVTIGESDPQAREVRGRIQPTELGLVTNWQRQLMHLGLCRHAPVPKPLEGLSHDESELWLVDWHQSEAGRAASRQQANHTVEFESDGTFAVHGVLPGEYELSMIALPMDRVTKTSWNALSAEWSGRIRRKVLIPERDSAASESVVDLGEIEMPIQRQSGER